MAQTPVVVRLAVIAIVAALIGATVAIRNRDAEHARRVDELHNRLFEIHESLASSKKMLETHFKSGTPADQAAVSQTYRELLKAYALTQAQLSLHGRRDHMLSHNDRTPQLED